MRAKKAGGRYSGLLIKKDSWMYSVRCEIDEHYIGVLMSAIRMEQSDIAPACSQSRRVSS